LLFILAEWGCGLSLSRPEQGVKKESLCLKALKNNREIKGAATKKQRNDYNVIGQSHLIKMVMI